MKRIGLIGGMSWESTAVYYRLLNEAVRNRLGGLHSADIVMRSFDFAQVEAMQLADDWAAAGRYLAGAARDLERAGAHCVLICTNTMHKVADDVQTAVSIPLIHIADATAEAIAAQGLKRPLLLATRYTMEQEFYVGRLREQHGIDVAVPDPSQRDLVHGIIFGELCVGQIVASSKQAYLDVISDRQAVDDIDGVILGCTEIGLLISQSDTALPVLDTTSIHADAALDFALS
jgi:aspartate racemase